MATALDYDVPFFDEDKRKLPVDMPLKLQAYGRNSSADGFMDIANNPLTKSLKKIVQTVDGEANGERQIPNYVIDSYVCSVGRRKAERLTNVINNVPRKKKQRGFGQRYEALIEAERCQSQYRNEYSDKWKEIKEPKRRSLQILDKEGEQKIAVLKEADDKNRLDKMANMCRGIRWVQQQYDATDRSLVQDSYKKIDLALIDRPKTINKWASKVPLGTCDEGENMFNARQKAKKGMRKTWNDGFSRTESEYDRFVADALDIRNAKLEPPVKILDTGEKAKETFQQGHGSNKWKSENRLNFGATTGGLEKRKNHEARRFCQFVDYNEPEPPEMICLFNTDTFPTCQKNPYRRKAFL